MIYMMLYTYLYIDFMIYLRDIMEYYLLVDVGYVI